MNPQHRNGQHSSSQYNESSRCTPSCRLFLDSFGPDDFPVPRYYTDLLKLFNTTYSTPHPLFTRVKYICPNNDSVLLVACRDLFPHRNIGKCCTPLDPLQGIFALHKLLAHLFIRTHYVLKYHPYRRTLFQMRLIFVLNDKRS